MILTGFELKSRELFGDKLYHNNTWFLLCILLPVVLPYFSEFVIDSDNFLSDPKNTLRLGRPVPNDENTLLTN